MHRNEGKFIESVLGILSFTIPCGLSVLTSSPEPYWLDSPEFTAAAQSLGIPHPPGHPLYVMLVKPLTLLPLGSISFRVSLASALFGALASWLLFKLLYRLIDTVSDELPRWVIGLVALTISLFASVTPGWWFQNVRAEVYSLQILIVLGALYPLTMFALNPRISSDRLLFLVAFLFGLGLANHHYIMLVSAPAAIPLLVAQVKHRGTFGVWKLLLRMCTWTIWGLMPYLFLPLRSMSGAPVALGGVHSIRDFFWVVSAKVYQKSMLRQHLDSLDERAINAIFSMMGELGPVVLVISLAGMYVLFRRQQTRMIGLIFSLLITITILLRAVMGFDVFNPDYFGYMLPTVVGFVVGLAVFSGALLDFLLSRARYSNVLAYVIIICLIILPVAKAREARDKADLSDFRSTRLFLDLNFTGVSPGALVLTTYYKLFFVLWSARYIDGSRPDITVVNPMFFTYPGYLNSALDAHPDLLPLAREMVVHGHLIESSVSEIAWKRPLRIEPDLTLETDVVRYMIPDGPVYKTAAEPMARADVSAAAPGHFKKWHAFYHLLGPEWEERETWRILSWCHFQDAFFFARREDRVSAKQAIAMSRALGNKAPELLGLEKALDSKKRGPIDVTPFLPEPLR